MDDPRFELELDETFDGNTLDERVWIPHYLPHWSTWEASAARYSLLGGELRLRIDADQPPWCPELDGPIRVSALQTALVAGPVGSSVGQHRFHPDATVRNGPHDDRRYTPHYGRVELRARVVPDPTCMVALWMIGLEDAPERSAEICVCEVFGSSVREGRAGIGVGLHPFGDPAIRDEFETIDVELDPTGLHTFAVDWTPNGVSFEVNSRVIKRSTQSPGYPMQLMLTLYQFPRNPRSEGNYPKEWLIDSVRGYRRVTGE